MQSPPPTPLLVVLVMPPHSKFSALSLSASHQFPPRCMCVQAAWGIERNRVSGCHLCDWPYPSFLFLFISISLLLALSEFSLDLAGDRERESRTLETLQQEELEGRQVQPRHGTQAGQVVADTQQQPWAGPPPDLLALELCTGSFPTLNALAECVCSKSCFIFQNKMRPRPKAS